MMFILRRCKDDSLQIPTPSRALSSVKRRSTSMPFNHAFGSKFAHVVNVAVLVHPNAPAIEMLKLERRVATNAASHRR